jgi:hypothetical protein
VSFAGELETLDKASFDVAPADQVRWRAENVGGFLCRHSFSRCSSHFDTSR